MKEKYDKYWGDPKKMNKVIFLAALLDPRYKFDWVQFTLCNMYGADLGSSIGKDIKEVLFSLFDEYKKTIAPENLSEQSDVGERLSEVDVDDPTMRVKRMVQSEYKRFKYEVRCGRGSKYEVEKYLNEEIEEDVGFNILTWWKLNSPRFPILSQVARDVLVVPISIIASESAFSTGGRVLDLFRSSLSPKIVQALLCTQDWLRGSSTPINVEEKLDDIEKLDQDLKTIALEPSTDS